jgi:cation-transporting ATPase 13A1
VQLTTFGVNYVGHPFNSGLSENSGMRRSLLYSGAFLAVLVSEVVPPINER